MSYAEKLRDPRWQKRRLEIFNRDEFTCQLCYRVDNELHVHHRAYFKSRDPWDYDDNMLVTLCKPCHDKCTELKDMAGIVLDDETDHGVISEALDLIRYDNVRTHTILAVIARNPKVFDSVYEVVTEFLAQQRAQKLEITPETFNAMRDAVANDRY